MTTRVFLAAAVQRLRNRGKSPIAFQGMAPRALSRAGGEPSLGQHARFRRNPCCHSVRPQLDFGRSPGIRVGAWDDDGWICIKGSAHTGAKVADDMTKCLRARAALAHAQHEHHLATKLQRTRAGRLHRDQRLDADHVQNSSGYPTALSSACTAGLKQCLGEVCGN